MNVLNTADWLIILVPILALSWFAIRSTKYARGVVDYLASGRVAGRYVLCVGDLAAGLSIISYVSNCELRYQSGWAIDFWGQITTPLGLILSLTGFYTFRWRETRCLSMGQFLELRYGSKFFRVFCATLRTIAEMITNAIGPAVATNFFIFYLQLPHKVTIWGMTLPCYTIIVVLCLFLATLFILPAGRITLLLTDSFQALMSYPIFVVIIGYAILNFSWYDEVIPVMANRVRGQSFLDPYNISQLRDFNIFATIVTMISGVLNRGSWCGNDTTGSARTPHEQKMAGVLGTWRNGFAYYTSMTAALVTITFTTSPAFFRQNRFGITSSQLREQVSSQVLEQAVDNAAKREEVMARLKEIPDAITADYITSPNSQKRNMDTPYFSVVRATLGDTPEGRFQFQKYRALYNQMLMPSIFSRLFPHVILGLFALLMIMLLISTDDSRIFNASSTLVQDVILPLFKGHLSAKKHILLLRLTTIGVSVFFLIVSLFFAQLDYINMFTTIMCAIWLGGAGPVFIFGIYSRFGNLVGAWISVISGGGLSLLGLICQRNWALHIYPYLERNGLVEPLNTFLADISRPFEPWISWRMDAVKFPINSYEIYFLSMAISLIGYIAGSYLTYKPYDLDRLLHRGKYADKDSITQYHEPFSICGIFRKIIGITPDYTKGDRIIAYSVFIYSFVYGLVICFFAVFIWNSFQRWPLKGWAINYFITYLLIPIFTGMVSTVWFLWGGIRDLRRLFIDLTKRVENPEDNGQILEHKD